MTNKISITSRQPVQISRQRLKALYKSYSITEIAKQLELSAPTVSKYLKRFGIMKKGAGNRSNHKEIMVLIEPRTLPDNSTNESLEATNTKEGGQIIE